MISLRSTDWSNISATMKLTAALKIKVGSFGIIHSSIYFKAVSSKISVFTSVCLDINLTLSDKVDVMERILPVN